MGLTAVELVAGVVDQVERVVTRTGRPSAPTVTVLKTLRVFLREGVQWRELRASPDRASGSTLRCRLTEWGTTALLRRVHAVLIRMLNDIKAPRWTGADRRDPALDLHRAHCWSCEDTVLTLKVTGMTCGGCPAPLSRAVEGFSSVERAFAN